MALRYPRPLYTRAATAYARGTIERDALDPAVYHVELETAGTGREGARFYVDLGGVFDLASAQSAPQGTLVAVVQLELPPSRRG